MASGGTLVILAFERLWQKDLKLKASLDYMVRLSETKRKKSINID